MATKAVYCGYGGRVLWLQRPCFEARHLKPARESPHITIDLLLSIVAARVYIIEKLRAYLREAGKDRRREGGRVRVRVHVDVHAHTCMHAHTRTLIL